MLHFPNLTAKGMSAPLASSGPLSLSGHALEGNKVVRLIYVDEAGISNKEQEPFLVVGAVIVHADDQLDGVERHFSQLVADWIPPEHRQGFVFHAKELFPGGGKVFNRADPAWPLSRRLELADALAAIPERFNLSLAIAFVEKSKFPSDPAQRPHWQRMSARDQLVGTHTAAFLSCALLIDRWMRCALPSEVSMMVVEDNDQSRSFIKEVTRYHQETNLDAFVDPQHKGWFPLRKIKEDPLFQAKRSYSVLQLADFWSYVFKRKLMNDDRYDRFVRPMWPCVIPDPATLGG